MADGATLIDPSSLATGGVVEERHLAALARVPVGSLLDNAAGTSLHLARVGDRTVPLVACEPQAPRASFLSPTGHYLRYPIEEIAKHSRFWNEGALAAALSPASLVLAVGAVERVVYANHWLTVGSPDLGLDRTDVRALIDLAAASWPNHPIVFSNVVPALGRRGFEALIASGCVAVPSRRVWIFDPSRPLAGKAFRKVRERLNREQRALRDARERSLHGAEALLPHVGRMRALHAGLYTAKHSSLNAQYTEAFLRLMLASPLVRSCGWVGDDGELEAFELQLASNGRIFWCLHGYDLHAPKRRGLNRLCFALDVEAARSSGDAVDWGGGADEFKRGRGGMPLQEFDLVHARHLTVRRRVPWALLRRSRPVRAPLELVHGGRLEEGA